MNPQLKQSWITALRSGRYQQGRGLLRERSFTGGAYFCAMGVLLDLVASPMQWDRLTRAPSRAGMADEVAGYVPPEILGDIGISYVQQALIAGLNDFGKTFEQIADVIEADFDNERRLRMTADHLVGGLIPTAPSAHTPPPVLKPQSLPDWLALAGVKPAAWVSPQQLKMYPAWT